MSWHLDELEYVECNFCSANTTRTVICRPDGLNIVECQVCGLAYVNPRPKRKYISRLYDMNYFTKLSESRNGDLLHLNYDYRSMIGYDDYDLHSPPAHAPAANYELDIVERHHELNNFSFLDIGCATGRLMQIAQLRGAKTRGIDISESAIHIARERYGLDAHVATVDEIPSGSKFDVIVAFEVIEHVPDPLCFLTHVRRLVNSNGVVAISTPNYANSFICGQDWIGFHMSLEHLYYFSDEVLSRLARRSGLETVEIRTMGEGLSTTRSDKGYRTLRRMLGSVPVLSDAVRKYRRSKHITPWSTSRDHHRMLAIFRPFNCHHT